MASAFAPRRAELPGLVLERRLHIPHGGGTPNLDAMWTRTAGPVGVEAKLTEHLDARPPRPWKPAYRRPAMREALEGGWRDAFDLLLDGRWAPRHLDAGQLVRHALSLAHEPAAELRYVFWDLDRLEDHRADLDRLLALVDGSRPRLVVQPWQALWTPALRERYDVAVR